MIIDGGKGVEKYQIIFSHPFPVKHISRLMLAWKTGENNACFEGLSFIQLSLLFFELMERESKEQNFKDHIRVTTSAVWRQTISSKKTNQNNAICPGTNNICFSCSDNWIFLSHEVK